MFFWKFRARVAALEKEIEALKLRPAEVHHHHYMPAPVQPAQHPGFGTIGDPIPSQPGFGMPWSGQVGGSTATQADANWPSIQNGQEGNCSCIGCKSEMAVSYENRFLHEMGFCSRN